MSQHMPLSVSQHIKNFNHLERFFWNALSIESLHTSDQVSSYLSDHLKLGFNFIFIHDGADIEHVQHAMQHFSQQQVEYVLVCETGHSIAIEHIQSFELEDDGIGTALYLDLAELQQSSKRHEALTLRMVNDQLDLWANPLKTAFLMGDDLTPQRLRAHQRALDQNLQMYHFVLEDQDRQVSNLSLTIEQNIARLDDLGTDIEFQGQGFATTLIQHVLDFAQQRGVTQCYVEATEQGLSVYHKLGFKTLFSNQNFVKMLDH